MGKGEKPRKSLKDQNQTALKTVLAFNFVVFSSLIEAGRLAISRDLLSAETLKAIIPSGLLCVLAGVLNDQFGTNAKARIVFWRWRNPLPGSEAFTKYAPNDARIDMQALSNTLGSLPNDPKEQNTVWYKLYRAVSADPGVNDTHRAYLLYRDFACIALLLLIALTTVAALVVRPVGGVVAYSGLLLLQYLLARGAAAHAGQRLVTNSLAAYLVQPRVKLQSKPKGTKNRISGPP